MFDLSGKTALVTGSTQGIGFEIAKILACHGAKVFVNGRSEEKTFNVASTIEGAQAAVCDMALENCGEILYGITGEIDILVLNASVQIRCPWDKITSSDFDTQMTVNFKAPFSLIQKYVPNMLKKGYGRILTVGSVQQTKPHKDMLVYAASKAALLNSVINLSKQLAPFGVTVNNIAPGVIDTPRNTDALSDKDYNRAVLEKIPCGYVGNTCDCASLALLLCSEESRYITGEDIYIDGGMKL